MAQQVTYHEGGFLPAAPQQNRAELVDGAANLFTRWNRAGAQVEQRPLTSQEIAGLVAQDAAVVAVNNGDTVRARAKSALTQNATYLAIASPTAAQNTAQVKRLTRELNGLVRLLLSELQDVSDT